MQKEGHKYIRNKTMKERNKDRRIERKIAEKK